MAGYSGISPQMEGPTHHAITDPLPGMTVVSPADASAMRALLPQVAAWPGPVYFRFSRNEVPDIFDGGYAPQIGKATQIRDGRDVTLIGVGTLVGRCLEAADLLAMRGIAARVLDMSTIKPLDSEAVLSAARETGAIITAEEHNVIGGLGGAVAELVAEVGVGVPVRRIGLRDRFAESGGYYEMLDKFGMSATDIAHAAEAALASASRRPAGSRT